MSVGTTGTQQGKIVIQGRLVWAAIDNPYVDNGVPSYKVCIAIPKTNAECLATVKEAAKQAYISRFGSPAFERKKPGWAGVNDGDTKTTPDVNLENCFYINLKSKNPPNMLNSYGEACGADQFYLGCEVNVVASGYAYEFQGQRGVTWYFSDIMFQRDGEVIVRANTASELLKAYIKPAPAQAPAQVATQAVAPGVLPGAETSTAGYVPVTLEDFNSF